MSKTFLLFLLIAILAGRCFSQEPASQIIHLDSIPAERGIILNKGWKFHAGDDPQLTNVRDDDAAWHAVDPTLGLHNLPIVKKAGIGWFKLKMNVDSSLMNETLAMELNTQGASEIYLNGILIYRFGIVSSDFKKEQTRFITNRPFSLKLGDQALQEIAIRYSFHHRNVYLNIRRAPCMSLILKENNQAFADYLSHEGFYQNLRSIQLSFYLPLGFLLLFLFYSYRLQKEYLYIGIFSFCMFLGMLMRIFGEMGMKTVNQVSFFVLANQLFWVPGLVVLIIGTYFLFKKHKSWAFYFIVMYALLIFPFLFLFHDWGPHVFSNCFVAVVIIEFLGLNIQAFRDGKPGAIILMITGITCLLLMIGGIALEFMGRRESSFFLLSLNFIMPALGLSLFFAGEFARTSLSLQSRLVEVQQLSEKTIAQEKGMEK